MGEKLNLREQGLGHMVPLKTAAMEDALTGRPSGWEFTR